MVATNLALSIANVQILDCDVEEPNAHIFIKPEIINRESVCVPVPQVDETRCDYCGKCQEVCAYNAVAVLKNTILIFPELCHGCGSCGYFCPRQAIKEIPKEIGVVEVGKIRDIEFVHGQLNVGEAMAPPVIRAVKKHMDRARTVVIDSPPGTSCPVIESIKTSDFCVLVTEPTPFGLNDLILAVDVVRTLGIPFGVVVNRSDLGDDKTDLYCLDQKIPILMRIPFERKIAEAYSKGEAVVETLPGYKEQFQRLFEKIKEI